MTSPPRRWSGCARSTRRRATPEVGDDVDGLQEDLEAGQDKVDALLHAGDAGEPRGLRFGVRREALTLSRPTANTSSAPASAAVMGVSRW
jgi:hypothetical protein